MSHHTFVRLACVSLISAVGSPALALPPIGEMPSVGADPDLPEIDAAHAGTVLRSSVIGWPEGMTPKAAEGLAIEAYQRELDNPRWLHVLDNGDVLVAEAETSTASSADRITLLRDTDGDGEADERHTLLEGLSQPFGMLAQDGYLYVANTDALLRYPFTPGETSIEASPEQLLELPAGGYNNHWTRNLVASPDGETLYLTVGSASNNGEYGMETERGRAAIHRLDPDGGNHRIYASGIRNPNGIAFEPQSGAMWTAVNERDDIGDDLVPDYVTSVEENGFYGWPYFLWGERVDPQYQAEAEAIDQPVLTPDFAVGAHASTMSILFPEGDALPADYREGAFIAQRGSWNRSELAGYRVIYLPFTDGRPDGEPRDVLTGFVADAERAKVHGRPTGLAQLPDGTLLVADDAGDTIWRVRAQ